MLSFVLLANFLVTKIECGPNDYKHSWPKVSVPFSLKENQMRNEPNWSRNDARSSGLSTEPVEWYQYAGLKKSKQSKRELHWPDCHDSVILLERFLERPE